MSRLDQFKAARLYAISCSPADRSSFEVIRSAYQVMTEAACKGGVRIFQLREKGLTGKELFDVARDCAVLCKKYGTLFILNDDIATALAVEADGVHLGQDDLPVVSALELRDKIRPDFLVGCSTHSVTQARKAFTDGADYIGIGPVFATPTKPTYEPVGIDLVRAVTTELDIPHVAIGGIDGTNVQAVLDAGAKRVAVVRAVCGSPNVEGSARTLIDTLNFYFKDNS